MTRRFEGAITTPEETLDSTSLPPAERPARPISIEIGAAILVVGGFVAVIGTIGAALGGDPAAADPAARPVIALILALNVLTMIVGLLVRRGQAWVACINVVAVVLFLELTAVPAGNATAAVLALLDGFVFVALVRNRDWFDWRPPTAPGAR
jgi:uncharacterized ion transporter superfamily protein YfcC